MTDQPLNIQESIEKDRVDALFARSITASRTLLIICAIYIALLSTKFDPFHLLQWYMLLIASLLGRFLLAKKYAESTYTPRALSWWVRIFRLCILILGLILGSLNIFFFPAEPLSFTLLAILFPFGIAAGAVSMLVDRNSFILYAVTLLSPVVYQMVQSGEGVNLGAALLTVILGIYFIRFSGEYNRTFLLNTKLGYENKALLNDLQEERNKLHNRLGRILNDNTTEIYVADADSFKCLQVNQGAVDNLGYSREEFHDITLLDIFVDLDRPALKGIIAPLYNGRVEPIRYNGNNRRKDGSIFPVEANIQLSTVDNPPIIVANVKDITERTNWEKKLIYQANYDQLTDIFNRHYIQSYMHSVFTRARRHKKKVALLFLDLDHFKNINDTLGHEAGDEVLKQTARRISEELRESDVVARTGGDEFTIFLENLDETTNAEIVARKLIDAFQQPFDFKGQDIYTTVSIGISIYPDDGTSHEELMQCADMAMYQAKQDGRNLYHFFSKEMRRISEEQLQISNQLRDALSRNELSLAYQPKIDIDTGEIVGAEALLRWHNPQLGQIPPSIFVPLAENLGIINELGTWVLEWACKEAYTWYEMTGKKIHIAVNVSPQQFRTGFLRDDVKRALDLSGIAPEQLELEITESLLTQDSDRPLDLLRSLVQQGVRLALDDFGTGYSSLSYLRKFPLQVLKIDRSFIQDLEEDRSHKVLVETIIAMAGSLDLQIVAEGVENNEQLDFLRHRGVKLIQGYIFSPPVPAVKFRELLTMD